jgi:hypothetical protein
MAMKLLELKQMGYDEDQFFLKIQIYGSIWSKEIEKRG